MAQADFGPTDPKFIFPIGGTPQLTVDPDPKDCRLVLMKY